MANVEKFVLSEAGRLLSHCSRTQKNLGEHIDSSRTSQNYNLADGLHNEYTDYQFLKHRIYGPGVRMLNRANVKVACSWAVTIPKDLLDEEPDRTKEFFEKAYDFFKERHGEENIISAYVHMDEYRPHMHFIFVPIVEEKNRPGYKVCAKEALNGCFGARFHAQFKEYMSHEMGREINVANGATIEGFKSVEDLKRGTAIRRVKELDRQMKELEERIKREKAALRVIEAGTQYKDADLSCVSISDGYAIMDEKLWESIKNKIILSGSLQAERNQLSKEIDNLRLDNLSLENQQLSAENSKLKHRNRELEEKNISYKDDLQMMTDFLQTCEIEGRNGIDLYEEHVEELHRNISR